MFLSDKDIEMAIKSKEITLEPFEKKQLQPASYDIRLGNLFVINNSHSTGQIDPMKGIYPTTHSIEIADNETFVLHPNASVLAYSKEYFGSDCYLIKVNNKSSLARIGLLIHNSSGLVNPGHFLNIALELCNLNDVPIILRPSMEIAQLTFSPLSSKSQKNYKETNRYHLTHSAGYTPPRSGPLARTKKKRNNKK